MTTIRIYLPDTFIRDVRECDPDLEPLWSRISALPQARRGGGTGRWAELTDGEVASVRKEAHYRAEYWLTDGYGPDHIQPHERSAGRAAKRVLDSIDRTLASMGA